MEPYYVQSAACYQKRKRRVNMKLSNLTHHNVGTGRIFFLVIMLMCFAMSATAGTISGRVTGGNVGVPAWVYVYSTANQYSSIGYAHTDANGDYTVTDLAAGEYKVKFDADYNYIDEWYNDKSDFDSADTVTVTASGAATDINAVLEFGGSISGKMTDAGGTGISGYVEVYDSNQKRIAFEWTEANGEYTATGLPTGNHKVKFTADGNYFTAWYNNKADFATADTVTVTAPDTTTGIDAVLAPSGGISGRMTDAGGTGISGYVYVYASTDQYQQGASAYADANGDYTVGGLANGDYKVKFEPDGNYMRRWYNDQGDFNSADTVTVTAPETTTGIDAVLVAGGGISGRITDSGGTGISGEIFLVEDLSGIYGKTPGTFTKTSSTRTDADGNYTFTGLRSDDHYKVKFQPDGDYANEWYNDKTNKAEADTITVTAPNTTAGIDAVLLADAGAISGKVTDAAGGEIAGVSVGVYDMNKNIINSNMMFTGYGTDDFTDANGDYTVTNLPAGEYKILFSNPLDGYLSEWYDDKPDFDNAVSVSVTALNTTPNINAVLAPSGSISGRVTDAAGQPVSGLWISASYSETFGTRAMASTDSNGEYKLNGLDTGSYKVHFEARGELDEWYNNKPDFESADSVAVTAPNNTTGIDAVLEPEQATVPITPILMLLLQK